jgi:lysine N6-hydroxylase
LNVIGIGAGPANLSAAVLFEPLADVPAEFYEAKEQFAWHPGLLLDGATLQSPYLKDLVTLANPCSPYTFLNYLFCEKRFHRFLIANFVDVTRAEFDRYFRWASARLSNLRFGRRARAVDFRDGAFRVRFDDGERAATDLILGSGQTPYVPDCARPYLGANLFHAGEFLLREPLGRDLRVAVVGGGQTGAEIVLQLLRARDRLPRRLTWITRRPSFHALDESVFANELYTPAYANYFFGLPAQRRARLLAQQRLASDGIKESLLQELYRTLYSLDFLEGRPGIHDFRPGHELVGIAPRGAGWVLTSRSDDGPATHEADVVILATGFSSRLPDYLEPLAGRIGRRNGELAVRADFSLEWDGPADRRLYVQGLARHARGIQDTNLGLIAWRSATIVNSIAGRTVYDVDEPDSTIALGVARAPGEPAWAT